jgi:hypothetical protein
MLLLEVHVLTVTTRCRCTPVASHQPTKQVRSKDPTEQDRLTRAGNANEGRRREGAQHLSLSLSLSVRLCVCVCVGCHVSVLVSQARSFGVAFSFPPYAILFINGSSPSSLVTSSRLQTCRLGHHRSILAEKASCCFLNSCFDYTARSTHISDHLTTSLLLLLHLPLEPALRWNMPCKGYPSTPQTLQTRHYLR